MGGANPRDIASGSLALVKETGRRCRGGLMQRQSPFRLYGGHSSVTASLIVGLRQLGESPSLNPLHTNPSYNARLGILAGTDTLNWLVRSHIDSEVRAAVGPNLFVTPKNVRQQLLDERIAFVVTPSSWVRNLYLHEAPELTDKTIVWAAGVDTDFWVPRAVDSKDQTRQCLIYAKKATTGDLKRTYETCTRAGFRASVLKYGHHSRSQYLSELQGSTVVIYLGGTESQSLAQFEAWSVGVPTLVKSWAPSSGRDFEILAAIHPNPATCSSPYLNSQTGRFWNNEDDLYDLLKGFSELRASPRTWVQEHFSLPQAAARYLTILQDCQAR